jgi:hypothetical protein
MAPAALDVGVCPVRAANVFSDFPSQAMLSTATYAAHSEHVTATADDTFCEQQQHWLRPTLVTAPRTSTRRQETDQ